MIFSQTGYDIRSAPCQTLVPTIEKSEPSLSDDVNLPSGSVMEMDVDHGNRQENTVLLNTTMEMTQSTAPEIVTVETKARKTGRKLKSKNKNKEQLNRSCPAEDSQMLDSADSKLSDSSPADTFSQKDNQVLEDVSGPEVSDLCQPKTECKSGITSRIPKLNKAKPGNRQKLPKHTKSKTESCDIVFPVFEDYFNNPEIQFSKDNESGKLPPDEDVADKPGSKITCRRSRTKGRRMSVVNRKTVKSPVSESCRSILDLEEDVMGKYEASKQQQTPKELLLCADEATHTESKHSGRPSSSGNKPQSKIMPATSPGGSPESRCRRTFIIPEVRDSTALKGESEVFVVDRDSTSSAVSHCEVEGPSEVPDANVSRQRSAREPHKDRDGDFVKETQSSCKRPWVATQDSTSLPEDLSFNDKCDEVLPLDDFSDTCTDFQKPKKARRQESGRSGKKKSVRRDECVDRGTDKKQNKRCRGNKGLRPEDAVTYLQDPYDALLLHESACMEDPDGNKQQSADLHGVDSHADVSEKEDIFLSSSKPNKSKSRMDCNPKHRRKTSKRETFVFDRRKTHDIIPLSNTKKLNVSGAYSHTREEAAHQNLGDMLTDEIPPWLDMDNSTYDTEVVSLLCSPKGNTWRGTGTTEETTPITAEAPPGDPADILHTNL